MSDDTNPIPIEKLKAEITEPTQPLPATYDSGVEYAHKLEDLQWAAQSTPPQPPPDADPGSAGAIVAQMDHVINQANVVKKLIYGGQAASVIRRDIKALLAQMDRDINTAVKANSRLAPGEIYPADWRKSVK